MNIFVIVAFVCTKMLFTVMSFDYNVNNQIIGRPFIMFIRTCNKNCQGCAAFIHQKMDFTAGFASIGRILACFGATQWSRSSSCCPQI